MIIENDERHEHYKALLDALDTAGHHLRGLLSAEPQAEWEVKEAGQSILLARRYLGKIAERLYCNFADCKQPLARGEGVQYYKGRVHESCLERHETT